MGDPLINDDHILALELATGRTACHGQEIRSYGQRRAEGVFLDKGLKLIDFKIEIRTLRREILLADAISPRYCRDVGRQDTTRRWIRTDSGEIWARWRRHIRKCSPGIKK
jgi:phosphoribosylaminoimidazole-succinocarboxamide synthase